MIESDITSTPLQDESEMSVKDMIFGPSADTEIRVIRDSQEFDALESSWNELTMTSGTEIFQTFEWNRIWWKHFCQADSLFIIAVYNNEQLAGLAPFFEDKYRLFGTIVYKALRLLGSFVSQPDGEPLLGTKPYSDYLDFIIRPGQENLFNSKLTGYLVSINRDFDEIILDEVPEKSSILKELIPRLEKTDLLYRVIPASQCPVIDLPSDWETYLSSKNVKERYHARKFLKRSMSESNKVFRVSELEDISGLSQVLQDFVRIHQHQWNMRGFPGTFAEQRMLDFFTEIAVVFHNRHFLQFKMAIPASANGNPVAINVILKYRDRMYVMFRALDEENEYRKLGPGNVLINACLFEAIQNNFRVYDLLRGSQQFKLSLASRVRQNSRITINDLSPVSMIMRLLIRFFIRMRNRLLLERIHFRLSFKDRSVPAGWQNYIGFFLRRLRTKYETQLVTNVHSPKSD